MSLSESAQSPGTTVPAQSPGTTVPAQSPGTTVPTQSPAATIPGLSSLPAPAFALVLVFFLLSGLSGLIYEVIWTRVLLTVFGATIYAVSTVLAAFMGGLALGSWGGGKLADRIRRPLRFYGILEILIGCMAVCVPRMLDLFDPVYRAIYASGNASFMQLSLVRFSLSFLVLLIPTTCMGATLPVLSRFLVRRGGTLGSRIGGLYAINTTGAVLGTFLAGFVFIARFGTHGTILLAALVSVLVGAGAVISSLLFERPGQSGQSDESDQSDWSDRSDGSAPSDLPAWLVRVILATYAVSGFVALAYQVFWSRALVFRFDYLKNTTYSFSAMLTVFLVGLALGSAFMSLRIDRQRDPVRLYGLLQILLGLSGAFSLFALISYAGLVQFGEPMGDNPSNFNWTLAVANVFLRTVLTIGLPTLLMGMAFPVAARLCVRRLRSVGAGTGRLYALNTLGAIVGSFAAGFVLIPIFGLARGLLVLGLVNVLLGTLVLLVNPFDTRKHKVAWSAMSLAALVLFFIRIPQQYPFQSPPEERHKIISYREGSLATVSVIEDSIGDRTLFVDNVGVAGTDRVLLTDQKSLAHVPMLILPNPKSALTVGFGSGGASWSYLLYKELERIDCIEICQTVPEMAGLLKDSNHGVLDEWKGEPLAGRKFHNGRYQVILDDARSYLRFTNTRYDIIATDCTDLRYKSNANLYDREYFELCRNALTDNGMVVVWMPLGGMSPDVFACAMKTFAQVFPEMTIWFMNNEPTHYLLLLGTRQPLRINVGRMIERISRPDIAADLQEVSLTQPERILASFLEAAPALERDWARAPLNTESFPYLEFECPKYGYNEEPLVTNLESLRKRRSSVIPYLEDAAEHPDFIERLKNFERATDAILEGHRHLRRLMLYDAREELRAACKEYMTAARICPDDLSVQFLLTFDTLRRRAERYPDGIWAVTMMGEIEQVKGNHRPAAEFLDRSLRLAGFMERKALADSESGSRAVAEEGRLRLGEAKYFGKLAVLGLARCYQGLQQPAKALELLKTYQGELGGDKEYLALRKELERR